MKERTALARQRDRYHVIDLHVDLVRGGKYEEANLVLRLLRYGRIKLGLYDSAFNVELSLEKIGLRPYYDRNGNYSIFHI